MIIALYCMLSLLPGKVCFSGHKSPAEAALPVVRAPWVLSSRLSKSQAGSAAWHQRPASCHLQPCHHIPFGSGIHVFSLFRYKFPGLNSASSSIFMTIIITAFITIANTCSRCVGTTMCSMLCSCKMSTRFIASRKDYYTLVFRPCVVMWHIYTYRYCIPISATCQYPYSDLCLLRALLECCCRLFYTDI
jgi:hypothetical protein